ncbi:MAG: alkaline phosphatase [Clostridia bacterium]|nr:alkaline phosphatase [Clostridia bacterium]
MSPFVVKFIGLLTTILLLLQSAFIFPSPNKEKTDFEQCKNVIFMIGDGMGFNSIAKTKAETGASLVMDTFEIRGESRTASANSVITDSAAGGTALATGFRTFNGAIGVFMGDKNHVVSHPMNLTELAISQGKPAGVITTDSTAGATPGSFSAHTSDRDNESDITAQQLAGDLTLCWGTTAGSFTSEAAEEYGWTHIYNKETMDALTEGSRSFGQFTSSLWHVDNGSNMPTLAEMTEKAIDLLDDDEDGFFLMVEGAHIDKNSHDKNGEGMKDALLSFDAAIATALEYAKADGETLVVITADHETGGIILVNGEYKYTSGGHTGTNVPLLVYGCENFLEGEISIPNIEVARRVACAMGEENFPIRVDVIS